MSLLGEAVAGDRLVVAIDPGKVQSRVWLSSGERGLVAEPVSLPTSRAGLAALEGLVASAGGSPLIALEQTGALHRAWQVALEDRWPGALRVFAPSETQAARAQLGSRRVKTDDRDCAALTWLARQGVGRPALPPRSRRCRVPFATVAGSSTPAARCASACTTSSTRSARGSRLRAATVARWSSSPRPARPCWPARRPLQGVRPRCAR
ncbi:MAG: hypothetical protein M3433_03040 [Actinomycetota bacterium]|nr:hypothetical protein [Actinomycetota bacterium]